MHRLGFQTVHFLSFSIQPLALPLIPPRLRFRLPSNEPKKIREAVQADDDFVVNVVGALLTAA
jgi:hypothetical protein